MRFKLIVFLLIFQITSSYAQGYKEIYFIGVPDLEILVFDFSLEAGGKITDIKRNSEKSTYDNPEIVNKLISMLEENPVGDYDGEKIQANFTIKLINPKYENAKLTSEDCEKLDFLREGKFVYVDPNISDLIVERKQGYQTEKSETKNLKSEIKWLSNCQYTLFNPEPVGDPGFKKSDVVDVEIIGVLANNTVIYKALLNDQVYTGVMRKL